MPKFWDTIKEISPKTIEQEADKAYRLALVGDSESVAGLREALLTPRATAAERTAATEYLSELADPPDAESISSFDFVLYASGSGGTIGARGQNSVPLVGSPADVAAGMIAQRPDLTVALARRFPLFRVPAANRLIKDASRANANFALISALPTIIPATAFFLPSAAVADILVLTKNQIMLVMRLAAVYGQKPGYTKQIKELVGTLGSALGWRTLARELVGLVPVGIGAALKATIAYSGTFAVGKAALLYYQTGRVPAAKEIRSIYKGELQEARKEVDELRERQR